MKLTTFQINALTVAGLVAVAVVAARRLAPQVAAAVNPLDKNNLVNQGATALVNTIDPRTTPDGRNLSIGDRVFIFFNPEASEKIGLIKPTGERQDTSFSDIAAGSRSGGW